MAKGKPNMRDVANLAQVSVSAVSLVVRHKPGVADETRERIWAAISELGYVVSEAQEEGRPPVVALMIERGQLPVMLDIFYGEVISGFQSEAQRLGYQVLLHMFDRNEERFDLLIAKLSGEVQGLVIANDGSITAAMVSEAVHGQPPLVLIESYLPGQAIPCVIGDNFVAGYSVTKHLIERGHRQIQLLGGPPQYSSLTDRYRGAQAALIEHDLLYTRIPAALHEPSFSYEGYQQMQRVLAQPERPSAIVAVHDKIAFGAMEAIKEAGLRIPADIAIVSIDDVAESAHTRPPLTTYRIPRSAMGKLAMQKLHRLVQGEQDLAVKSLVYGELIVRASSG